MKRKGFTLIELLAVIIILAVIALIATPVVLNVIENSRKQANRDSVYGILDGAKYYYAESLLDTAKSAKVNGITNLISEVKVSGTQPPEDGILYIKSNGEVAIAVVYDNVCYKKEFTDNDLSENEDVENCSVTPGMSYKCVRATKLHTEECTQTLTSVFCNNAGYTPSGSKGTTTITYGNLGTSGAVPVSGDAFDCDVNGDGTYDSETERFYYVSDLSSDSEYAVLIYSNNTTSGVADNTSASLVAYDSSNTNYNGPRTAISNLPTTTQWSNVSLSNTSRAITTETGTISTGGGKLPTAFSYEGYAARLLTAQEMNLACGITVGTRKIGELDSCNYLMENTKYSNDDLTYGYWLETPRASDAYFAWQVNVARRYVDYINAYEPSIRGVRPVIEILKSEILF